MAKINGRFESLFEYLVQKNFPLTRWLDKRFYPEEHNTLENVLTYENKPYYVPFYRRYSPKGSKSGQTLGSLQPIVDMGNDFVNTFQPYKSARQVGRDFLQPIRGIGNIAKGIVNIIAAPLLFIINPIRYAFISGTFKKFKQNVSLNSQRTISWLLNGISSIFRGVTQIATTPLTWSLKMPLRGLITAFKGVQKIEENKGVQRLVQAGKNAIASNQETEAYKIRTALHYKYQKGIRKGQNTDIINYTEETLFNLQNYKNRVLPYQGDDISDVSTIRKDRSVAALLYFSLFSANKKEQNKVYNYTENKLRLCSSNSNDEINEYGESHYNDMLYHEEQDPNEKTSLLN